MYTVVFNMPGCLPEAEPIDAESIEDARNIVCEHIISVMQGALDSDEETRPWEYALTTAKSVPAEGGWFKLPDGYVADIQKVEAGQNAD